VQAASQRLAEAQDALAIEREYLTTMRFVRSLAALFSKKPCAEQAIDRTTLRRLWLEAREENPK
jgi:hypothetical protein